MEETGSDGCRRKRRRMPACVNSLFSKWLQEWRDEAIESGSKTSYTYSKALNALKKYPLRLQNGQEAKVLSNIGDKIANMLDKKLSEHLSNGGSMEDLYTDHDTLLYPKKVSLSKEKSTTTTTTRLSVSPGTVGRGKRLASQCTTDQCTDNIIPKKRQRAATKKEYVPAHRSGPYAILITLLRAEQELIDLAQPFSDKSFTIPDPGSYYTAWSSVSSLIKRNLLVKVSHPPRYSITEEGITLALRINQAETAPPTPPPAAPITDRTISKESISPSSRHSTIPINTKTSLSSSRCSINHSTMQPSTDKPCTSSNSSSSSPQSRVISSKSTTISPIDNDPICISDIDTTPTSSIKGTNRKMPCRDENKMASFKYKEDICTIDEDDSDSDNDCELPSVGYLFSTLNKSSKCITNKGKKSSNTSIGSIEDTVQPTSNQKLAQLKPRSSSTTNSIATDCIDITLSDSDSDCDIVPLAQRVGVEREKRDKKQVKQQQQSLPSPIDARLSNRYSDCDIIPLVGVCVSEDKRDKKKQQVKQQQQQSLVSPIDARLSDSDSDCDIIPLAQRVGVKRDQRNKKQVKQQQQSLPSPIDARLSNRYSDCDIIPLVGVCVSEDKRDKKKKQVKQRQQSLVSQTDTRLCPPPSIQSAVLSSSKTTAKKDLRTNVCSSKDTMTRLNQPSLQSLTSQTAATIDHSSDGSIQKEFDLQNPLDTFNPGEFEVVLCIDNTESSANRKSTSHFRGLLLEELNKNGVKFSVRKLNVGDFLWIARENIKISHGRAQLRQPDAKEIVLEHIIERKRMDDLAGSIIDKRFNEQKFRMKNSGIYNPIYLVEEHGDVGHCKISELALRQAITNTQILDEFYIKEAKDIRDSIAYLTVMTRHIQLKYSGSVIKGYPVDTMVELNKRRRNGQYSLEDSFVPGIPFTLFNESSVKTKVSTVSEMFGRHLIQIPNSSAEKAAAVIDIYPTASHLRDAYSNCNTDKERDNLLTPLRTGDCKRRFGPVLSALICRLYWKA